jgi:hypothetical protein
MLDFGFRVVAALCVEVIWSGLQSPESSDCGVSQNGRTSTDDAYKLAKPK